jgi:tocopherol O-methyltransferase
MRSFARCVALVALLAGVAGRAASGAGVPSSAGAPAVQEVYSRADLKAGIAGFYDASSGLWEGIWGEHMHHGYYPKGGKRKDHRQAQVDMIDETLAWARAGPPYRAPPRAVLDVGCGIGGSSRHIARKYGCRTEGVTLSPKQAARGNALAVAQGLGDRCRFRVADALALPFKRNAFDLIWSMESGEHMPDKAAFVHELARVVKPGGQVIVVTWCHRDLAPGESALKPREQRLLRAINRAFYLPAWCSIADYEAHMAKAGLRGVRRADWTDEIAAFWPAVIGTALKPSGLLGLAKAGATTTRGALVMPLMIRGYKMGLIKFGLITAEKPKGWLPFGR